MAKAKKLPSGNWRCLASKMIDGNRINKSFTAKTKKEAEIMAMEWQVKMEEYNADLPILASAYERYIASKEKVLSPSTIRSYKQMSRTTMQSIMQVKIDRITHEQIQRSVNEYAASHSPKSVANAYGLFTAVMDMFCPDFRPHAKLPSRTKTDIYIPTNENIKKILNASSGDLHIAIMLGAFAGMRRGEICALTSDDIIGNKIKIDKALSIDSDGIFQNKPPKTFSGYRYIEIPDFIKNATEDKIGKIITITPDAISCAFRKLVTKLDMPHFRFHDLRHFYVSHLFDLGLPEKYIIAQVGHSSSKITKAVYDHISKQKATDYSRMISESFSNMI